MTTATVAVQLEDTDGQITRIAAVIPVVRMALWREAERRGVSVFELLADILADEAERKGGGR